MAKTKTVKQKAWGVFGKDGKLIVYGLSAVMYETYITRGHARIACHEVWGETVRPVTISWEVDE